MQAQDVYIRVSSALQDMGSTKRWTWDFTDGDGSVSLQTLLNQAIEAVFTQRPDSNSVTGDLSLVAGVQQSLPDNSYQLFEIIQNLGADGISPGKTITQIDRRSMDRFDRDWMNVDSATEIDHWAYDLFYNRKVFWVYPAVPVDGLVVLGTYAPYPDQITSKTDSLPLHDIYADSIYHHMMFQILTGDNEDANFNRGVSHFQIFMQKLGKNIQTDAISVSGNLGESSS